MNLWWPCQGCGSIWSIRKRIDLLWEFLLCYRICDELCVKDEKPGNQLAIETAAVQRNMLRHCGVHLITVWYRLNALTVMSAVLPHCLPLCRWMAEWLQIARLRILNAIDHRPKLASRSSGLAGSLHLIASAALSSHPQTRNRVLWKDSSKDVRMPFESTGKP